MNFPLDHIGIAVTDLNAAIEHYQKTWGYKLDLREKVPTQKVEVAFLKLPNTLIELLAPTDSSSTLNKFLTERGAGLHHICYKVPDIKAVLKRLDSEGHRLIDKEPRPGAHNTLIAFIHPKSMGGVLVELCEHRA